MLPRRTAAASGARRWAWLRKRPAAPVLQRFWCTLRSSGRLLQSITTVRPTLGCSYCPQALLSAKSRTNHGPLLVPLRASLRMYACVGLKSRIEKATTTSRRLFYPPEITVTGDACFGEASLAVKYTARSYLWHVKAIAALVSQRSANVRESRSSRAAPQREHYGPAMEGLLPSAAKASL